ncbi:DUF1292 domain-containing protein [Paenibacillus agaridevorans]|uniref:DUF1292 domain-containing protein n=1 Tax=Paenibacillus agaridevorans TaxID=171404 RepID=A0A2R5EQ24_9BACL|nr:DUF1292 domain-containing protein [Paenibacillus agaridevorans]GBG08677.1 DUF1292 domain-containing protein [Paenibacillus agaridevorans]
MSDYNQTPVRINGLKEVFGDHVELIAEDGHAEVYRIKAEFKLGDTVYAALQSDEMEAEDEVEFLRVRQDGEEPQLESIEDDEEWEAASEAYDDLQFASDDRP